MCYLIVASINRGVVQLVARQAHNLKVIGSSPIPATISQILNNEIHTPFWQLLV